MKVSRRRVGLSAYLGHLHLLLPGVNALLQPPVFLLGLDVLGDAGRFVLGHLAAQALVESLLPATLLGKDQSRCGGPSEVLRSGSSLCIGDFARRRSVQLSIIHCVKPEPAMAPEWLDGSPHTPVRRWR